MRLFTRFTHLIVQKSLGKELGFALILLRALSTALDKGDTTELTRFVFSKLPENWRDPKGPATEAEFIDMVNAGKIFLAKVKAAVRT